MRATLAALGIAISITSSAAPLTEAECNVGNPSTDQNRIADCIEANVTTNCDTYSGGSAYLAICSWGRVEVAERRIARAEKLIQAKLTKSKVEPSVLDALRVAQEQWQQFRERHCRFSNAIANPRHTWDNHDLQYVSCMHQLSEQRAKELEALGKRVR